MPLPSPPPPPPPPIPPAPPYGVAPQQQASQQAIGALVVGIISLVCCNILGPVAWILGRNEGKAIREGRAPAAGEVYAKVGMILGIVGTVLLGLTLLWLFMGGMAILSGVLSNATQH